MALPSNILLYTLMSGNLSLRIVDSSLRKRKHSAKLQILFPPISQDVILNMNATFICNGTVHVKWVILHEAIYPSNSNSVPLTTTV